MRRTAAAVALGLAILASSIPASHGSEPKRGTFSVTAAPFADYLYMLGYDTYSCFDGEEGVHKGFETFKAPAAGTLDVSATFEGDWDLALFDPTTGDMVAFGYHYGWAGKKDTERVGIRLRKGESIVMGACNWSSAQTTVEVTYQLSAGNDSSRPAAGMRAISPGDKARLHERVPVNFVFLGYERDDFSLRDFLAQLPDRYRPVVRAHEAYRRLKDSELGIGYSYDFKTTFTDKTYEDRFFEFLRSQAQPTRPTDYQVLYNEQERNVRDIDRNFSIHAPAVEKRLALDPPGGVDTRNYTVYFINWFGRKDYVHHTYFKKGEPDVDVGYDWGNLGTQHMSAWGGTPPDDPETGYGKERRVWFYDLSAGPEYRTRNYLVDDPDIDGDGRENFRLPPIWEYTKNGYRSPKHLGADLGKVARYVAINLLFTTSPLYNPALNAPRIPRTVNLDLNVYEGAPGFDASQEWVQEKHVLKKFQEWMPFYRLSVDEQDLDYFDPMFQKCLQEWMWLWGAGGSCYPDRSHYAAPSNAFVYNALNLPDRADDAEKVDYEAFAFNYVTPEGTGPTFGYADENYLDGTQSFTHTFVDTEYGDLLGMTGIVVHEFGHHFGGSHPHDGFDYERGIDYGFWYDNFLFTYAGTYSNSVMSYLRVNDEFGQFDRDNMNRWMTASYFTAVNTIAQEVRQARGSDAVGKLVQADSLLVKAQQAFSDHEYVAARELARRAHEDALDVAKRLGVKITGRWTGTTVTDEPGERSGGRAGRASMPRLPDSFRPAFICDFGLAESAAEAAGSASGLPRTTARR